MTDVELSRILAHHAAARRNDTAIADADGHFDFRTLQRRVNRLASALTTTGIRKGDRVALRLPNSRRHFEALFACARLGAILVPIAAEAAADDVDTIKRDSEPSLVLQSEQAYEALLAAAIDAPPAARASAGDPLLIMYTSGTTARPKGAVLSHGNVVFTSFNQIIGWHLTANDRALVVAPFHHAGGLLALGLPCLYAGGSVYVAPPAPGHILQSIERHRISAVFLPPRLWNRVALDDAFPRADVGSVRLCASGGDAIALHILDRLEHRFDADFTDSYGMTEAASCLTLLAGTDLRQRRRSAGKALAHTLIKIVSPDGAELPPGKVGEIVVSGPTITSGYWYRADETNAALLDGWLQTGDVGRIDDDGFLYVLDRRVDVFTSNGRAVYPRQVEAVLREHHAVDEAAVVGIGNPDGEQTAVAWVVPRAGVRLASSELCEYCRGAIAAHERPQEIFLVEALPRNPNGKILKAGLRQSYKARSSGPRS